MNDEVVVAGKSHGYFKAVSIISSQAQVFKDISWIYSIYCKFFKVLLEFDGNFSLNFYLSLFGCLSNVLECIQTNLDSWRSVVIDGIVRYYEYEMDRMTSFSY